MSSLWPPFENASKIHVRERCEPVRVTKDIGWYFLIWSFHKCLLKRKKHPLIHSLSDSGFPSKSLVEFSKHVLLEEMLELLVRDWKIADTREYTILF